MLWSLRYLDKNIFIYEKKDGGIEYKFIGRIPVDSVVEISAY